MAEYLQCFRGNATSVTSSTEIELSLRGKYCYLARVHLTRNSGTASSCAPVLGYSTDPADSLMEIAVLARDETIDETFDPPVPFYSSSQILYFRPRPDSGTDNNISYEIYVVVNR